MIDDGKSGRTRWRRWLSESGAAFADLGTFLPLVTGMLLLGGFEPTGVLLGFGIFALTSGVFYRCPIPTQPMKAVAALAITGSLSPAGTLASGLLIGAVLIALASSGAITRLDRVVPRTITLGIQIGLGLSLVASAVAMADTSLWIAALALAVLLATQWIGLHGIACLVLIAGGAILAVQTGAATLPPVSFGLSLPHVALPTLAAFRESAETALLPQLAMTITNAVLLTAALARDHFPEQKERTTPRNLAMSSGLLNILLAPFGAIPMCHGAGGLAAMRAQGARTGLAPIVFGVACLVAALALGPHALEWLRIVPAEIAAALLAMAGIQLAWSPRLKELRPTCLSIIGATAATALFVNVAVALLVGIALELTRSRALALRQPNR